MNIPTEFILGQNISWKTYKIKKEEQVCPFCAGIGTIKITGANNEEMHFNCPKCNNRRIIINEIREKTLEVKAVISDIIFKRYYNSDKDVTGIIPHVYVVRIQNLDEIEREFGNVLPVENHNFETLTAIRNCSTLRLYAQQIQDLISGKANEVHKYYVPLKPVNTLECGETKPNAS